MVILQRAEIEKNSADLALAKLAAAGVELDDVNGEPVLYRGYMTVKHEELWEVSAHGHHEFWVMSNCPVSTHYMYKRRYVVTNHYRVINGVGGNEWYECRSYALRAAGIYGRVYRYGWDMEGKWSAIEKVYGGKEGR